MNIPCDTYNGLQSLWRELLWAADRVHTRLEDGLGTAGLSLSKLGMLNHLVEASEPVPLSRLAGKMSCVKSNITQLVDRLESEGLVQRVYDPADRRSVLASITDQGRERQSEGIRIVAEIEQEIFGGLDPNQVENLTRMLRAFVPSNCDS